MNASLLIMASERIDRKPPENLLKADIELFEDAFQYETNDVYLRSFGTVRVSADSVVYKNGGLLSETLAARDQRFYYQVRHLAKKLLTGRSVALDTGRRYLLVTDVWSSGHFHWFMEVLPRIWTIRDKSTEFVLLLPDTPYVRKIGLESLHLLDLTFEDIILMKDREFYNVYDLYFVSRVTAPGRTHDRIMKEIRKAFVGGKEGGQEKIYISREKASVRRVLNEAELIPVLKSYGFEVLYGEDFSLTEQVDIFKKCSTLMGIHGAGLTNCLFMSTDGKVIELRKREPNYGYWHLASSLGHRYYYFDGEPDSEMSLIGKGGNLTVPIETLKDKLLCEN